MRNINQFLNIARTVSSGGAELAKACEGLGGSIRGVATELAVPQNASLPYGANHTLDVWTVACLVQNVIFADRKSETYP
jgi:hypothetical protein